MSRERLGVVEARMRIAFAAVLERLDKPRLARTAAPAPASATASASAAVSAAAPAPAPEAAGRTVTGRAPEAMQAGGPPAAQGGGPAGTDAVGAWTVERVEDWLRARPPADALARWLAGRPGLEGLSQVCCARPAGALGLLAMLRPEELPQPAAASAAAAAAAAATAAAAGSGNEDGVRSAEESGTCAAADASAGPRLRTPELHQNRGA